jgi:hypothetical protein
MSRTTERHSALLQLLSFMGVEGTDQETNLYSIALDHDGSRRKED